MPATVLMSGRRVGIIMLRSLIECQRPTFHTRAPFDTFITSVTLQYDVLFIHHTYHILN